MKSGSFFLLISLTLLVSGCGGGGGGGSEPDQPNQIASLSFSSSATQVDRGDTVTLTWSTSGLTSCSAYSSPDASFRGSIPLSGTRDIEVTTVGMNVYSINCSHSNGNKAFKEIEIQAYNTRDIEGTVLFSPQINGVSTINKDAINPQPGRDFPTEEDVFNYLCYSPVSASLSSDYGKSLSNILSNVDINNDEAPDTNLTGPFTSVYKNIASKSFAFDEVPTDPTVLTENFTPDLFLFDLHESLEKNIDLNNDGIADLNITRNFNSTSGTLSPSELIIFNIQIDPENNPDQILNKTEFNREIQFAEFELLNFDSNYDGVADLNIDTDSDGIADRSIDEDNDCFADFSYVDGEGVTVEGAEIRLTQIIMDNFTGEYTGFDEDRNAITDENGVFRFEDIRTGTEHRIWINKELENKNIHTIRKIEVPSIIDSSNWKMGAFPLTSSPILMGVELQLNELEPVGTLLGWPYGGENGFWDGAYDWAWNIGDKLGLKFFFEDPNKLDIYRKVPSAPNLDGSPSYEFIVADRPETTESGYSESLFEYEFRSDGCFNVTLNSYNPSFNGELEYFDNYCQTPADDQFTNVFNLREDMTFNNSDSRGFYSKRDDLRLGYYFGNDNRDTSRPPTDYIVESVEINSITYEHPSEENLPMWHNWRFCTYDGCGTVIEAADSNTIEVKINALKRSLDTEGYLTTFWRINGFEENANAPERVIGDRATFNFEDDAYPNYLYQIIGGVCITENEPDGYCRNYETKYILIDYEPSSGKAPSEKQHINLVINDENFKGYNCMWSTFEPCENYDQIFQVGDTLNIELFADDPNGLKTEFKVRPPKEDMSDWKPEITFDTYIIQEEDRGNTINIEFCWRNNDGVAESWQPIGQNYSELDGCHFVRLRVSE